MRTLTRRVIQSAAAAALAISGIAATAGSASAYSDSYCLHGTCLYGDNYYYNNGQNQLATVKICNNQSTANDFEVWIKDDFTGTSPTGKITTPKLSPGYCWSVTALLSDFQGAHVAGGLRR
ncbi:hypothetical protein AB0G73_37565 [Streptomyces sp. NPDC020719]|uniref:hypothetical protein n=1 Tax=Streptomyces sp. NPDC020719 TaxID=3154896 RepID=UPI0033E0A039